MSKGYTDTTINKKRQMLKKIRAVNNFATQGFISCKDIKHKNYLIFHLCNFSSKIAFTLAEVLITIGIIGIVAAITIPTIIQKQEEVALKNSWKKAYSVINQAYIRAIYENGGSPITTNFCSADYMKRVDELKKYLKITESCEYNSGTTLGRCWATKGVKNDSNINVCGGGEVGLQQANQKNRAGFATTDGTYVIVWPGCSMLYIDTNGNKGPNTWGKDVHSLNLGDTKITNVGTSCLNNDSNAINWLLNK